MKPVMQTRLAGADGNCFVACLASVFECAIADVPEFCDEPDWIQQVQTWLRPRNLGMLALQVREDSDLGAFEGWLIVSGDSGKGVEHATVWRDGQLVHDPHPRKPGLATVNFVYMLYPLDPSKVAQPAGGDTA
jgi:hypothetical protein